MSGEFSLAVVQANNLLEDQIQVESGSLSLHYSGPYGMFVGVYEGHGGSETARYVNDHLFNNIRMALQTSNCSCWLLLPSWHNLLWSPLCCQLWRHSCCIRRVASSTGEVFAELSTVHNHNIWRVKGTIQQCMTMLTTLLGCNDPQQIIRRTFTGIPFLDQDLDSFEVV